MELEYWLLLLLLLLPNHEEYNIHYIIFKYQSCVSNGKLQSPPGGINILINSQDL
jgi:hypothetical protein